MNRGRYKSAGRVVISDLILRINCKKNVRKLNFLIDLLEEH